MSKCIGIAIGIQVIVLLGVATTLNIELSDGGDQEVDQSTVITIGNIWKLFDGSDNFVIWITNILLLELLIGLVALINRLYKTRTEEQVIVSELYCIINFTILILIFCCILYCFVKFFYFYALEL